MIATEGKNILDSPVALVETRPVDSPLAALSPWAAEPHRLWSLLDMLRRYFPLYRIAVRLGHLASTVGLYTQIKTDLSKGDPDIQKFTDLLHDIQRESGGLGLTHTAKVAARVIARLPPIDYRQMHADLQNLDDSLSSELDDEAIFRIPPTRKGYFEQESLFGPEVGAAFPSCARDIQKAGSCYALEQEDACVFHLMHVLERGLNALAARLQVPFDYRNWQPIIVAVEARVKTLPAGDERRFYQEAAAQFGFLKDAYRNHAMHAHDARYDLDRALSMLNHVRDFMRALAQGGLSE